MGEKPKLRSRYCVKMQGLFAGVEWSVLRDGKVIATGRASDVEAGLESARFAYVRDVKHMQKVGRRHV